MLGIRGKVRRQADRVRARIVEDRVEQVSQGRWLLLEPLLDGEFDAGAVPASEIRDFGKDFVDAHLWEASAGEGGMRAPKFGVKRIKGLRNLRSFMSPTISPGCEKWSDS